MQLSGNHAWERSGGPKVQSRRQGHTGLLSSEVMFDVGAKPSFQNIVWMSVVFYYKESLLDRPCGFHKSGKRTKSTCNF